MVAVLLLLSMITISGLSVVTTRFGGMVPPADVWEPSKSIKQVYFCLFRHLPMYDNTLSCLNVYLPSLRLGPQQFKIWFNVCLEPHLHLSLETLPHNLRFTFVGRVSMVELRRNFIVPLGRLFNPASEASGVVLNLTGDLRSTFEGKMIKNDHLRSLGDHRWKSSF